MPPPHWYKKNFPRLKSNLKWSRVLVQWEAIEVRRLNINRAVVDMTQPETRVVKGPGLLWSDEYELLAPVDLHQEVVCGIEVYRGNDLSWSHPERGVLHQLPL